MATCVENFIKKYIDKYGRPVHPDWEMMAKLMCSYGFNPDDIILELEIFFLKCRKNLIQKKLIDSGLYVDDAVLDEITARLKLNEGVEHIEKEISERLKREEALKKKRSINKGPK